MCAHDLNPYSLDSNWNRNELKVKFIILYSSFVAMIVETGMNLLINCIPSQYVIGCAFLTTTAIKASTWILFQYLRWKGFREIDISTICTIDSIKSRKNIWLIYHLQAKNFRVIQFTIDFHPPPIPHFQVQLLYFNQKHSIIIFNMIHWHTFDPHLGNRKTNEYSRN